MLVEIYNVAFDELVAFLREMVKNHDCHYKPSRYTNAGGRRQAGAACFGLCKNRNGWCFEYKTEKFPAQAIPDVLVRLRQHVCQEMGVLNPNKYQIILIKIYLDRDSLGMHTDVEGERQDVLCYTGFTHPGEARILEAVAQTPSGNWSKNVLFKLKTPSDSIWRALPSFMPRSGHRVLEPGEGVSKVSFNGEDTDSDGDTDVKERKKDEDGSNDWKNPFRFSVTFRDPNDLLQYRDARGHCIVTVAGQRHLSRFD